MPPEHGSFIQRLQDIHSARRSTATFSEISRHFDPAANGEPQEQSDVELPGYVRNVASLLASDTFADWVYDVKPSPTGSKGDMQLEITGGTETGAELRALLGYDTATIKVLPNTSKVNRFIKKNLLDRMEDVYDWIDDKRIVLDGSATAVHHTVDTLFQLWVYSDTLFSPIAAQEYISQFDPNTQMILRTPEFIRNAATSKRGLIRAIYGDMGSSNGWHQIDGIVDAFCTFRM